MTDEVKSEVETKAPLPEVQYRFMNNLEASKLQCGFLMKNSMQCPTHAAVELVNVDATSVKHLCRYHLNMLFAQDTAHNYVQVD